MYIGTTKITDWSTWVVVLRSKKFACLQTNYSNCLSPDLYTILTLFLSLPFWFLTLLVFKRVFLCWCFKSLGSPSWVDYCCDEARGPMKGEPYGSNKRKTFKVANYAWTMHDLAYERCLSCMHNNCKIQGKYRPNNSWL